jgi:hypothetical protein
MDLSARAVETRVYGAWRAGPPAKSAQIERIYEGEAGRNALGPRDHESYSAQCRRSTLSARRTKMRPIFRPVMGAAPNLTVIVIVSANSENV